jgi:hypothetical protein
MPVEPIPRSRPRQHPHFVRELPVLRHVGAEYRMPGAGGVRQTCAVDSREIEQFEQDGYVAVRGAVDPDVTAACREAI